MLTFSLLSISVMGDQLQSDMQATFDNCGSFNNKLRDTLMGLINANGDRKAEIDALRGDHDALRKDHDDFVNSMERENDLRKNEIRYVRTPFGENSSCT